MMANSALTLSAIANIALSAGIDMGFSAAEVQRITGLPDFDVRLRLMWGDARLMKQSRLRTPMEYAMSWSDEEDCTREPFCAEFPESLMYEHSHDIRSKFVAALLEVEKGPARNTGANAP